MLVKKEFLGDLVACLHLKSKSKIIYAYQNDSLRDWNHKLNAYVGVMLRSRDSVGDFGQPSHHFLFYKLRKSRSKLFEEIELWSRNWFHIDAISRSGLNQFHFIISWNNFWVKSDFSTLKFHNIRKNFQSIYIINFRPNWPNSKFMFNRARPPKW